MDPNEIITLIDSTLPAEHWARSVLAFATMVVAALTAFGKCLDILVPAFRRWADSTVNTADDAAAERLERLAEWMAQINARTPRVTAGTRKMDATPSSPRRRRVPPLPVLLAFVSAFALIGCKAGATQRTLNVAGESLYAIDDALAPWFVETRARCLGEIEEMPDEADFDYESAYRECMAGPLHVYAGLSTLRIALREANELNALSSDGRDIKCEIVVSVTAAAGELVDRLDDARDFGIPAEVRPIAAGLASMVCETVTNGGETP